MSKCYKSFLSAPETNLSYIQNFILSLGNSTSWEIQVFIVTIKMEMNILFEFEFGTSLQFPCILDWYLDLNWYLQSKYRVTELASSQHCSCSKEPSFPSYEVNLCYSVSDETNSSYLHAKCWTRHIPWSFCSYYVAIVSQRNHVVNSKN